MKERVFTIFTGMLLAVCLTASLMALPASANVIERNEEYMDVNPSSQTINVNVPYAGVGRNEGSVTTNNGLIGWNILRKQVSHLFERETPVIITG